MKGVDLAMVGPAGKYIVVRAAYASTLSLAWLE